MDIFSNFIKFDIINDFVLVHLDEMLNLTYSINLEKIFEYILLLEFKGNSENFSEEENLFKIIKDKQVGDFMLLHHNFNWNTPLCFIFSDFKQQFIKIIEISQGQLFLNLFIVNFFFIKLFFFQVTSLNFWILPQIILFIGGLITFILIKSNDLNLKIWDLTQRILFISLLYQLLLLYLYLNFFELGIELKVGLSGLFKVPFNLFLMKLLSFTIILMILLISIFFLKKFYWKTLFLIKPELCSLILFLGFGSGMVFLQNDLFSIFLYLEIISFCIYGFLFLQQRNNSQLHGLIRYVLFSLWMAAFYILGIAMYLSWTNFNTNLSYLNYDDLLSLTSLGFVFNVSANYGYLNFEIIFSILFFLFYFLFKLGAGPFYTWVVEVYNSCSTGVLFTVSVLPKLIYVPVLFFLLFFNFIIFYVYWSILLFGIGLFTTAIGAIAILFTDKLKEIYSWSSIIHTGNILIILSCLSINTLTFCFFYLISYTIISFGFISIILSLWNKTTGRFIKTTLELSSINYLSSGFLIISVIMLASAAGFTPLLSFFMKFSLFSLISLQYGIGFAIIVGLLNIIGSIAYLKMLWNMIGYNLNFISFKKKIKPYTPLSLYLDYELGWFLNISCIIVCLGFFFYNEFLELFEYSTNVFYPDQWNIIVELFISSQ